MADLKTLYEKHRLAFAALGRETRGVRRPEELQAVAGLVIPGGESTTLTRLMDRVGLRPGSSVPPGR